MAKFAAEIELGKLTVSITVEHEKEGELINFVRALFSDDEETGDPIGAIFRESENSRKRLAAQSRPVRP